MATISVRVSKEAVIIIKSRVVISKNIIMTRKEIQENRISRTISIPSKGTVRQVLNFASNVKLASTQITQRASDYLNKALESYATVKWERQENGQMTIAEPDRMIIVYGAGRCFKKENLIGSKYMKKYTNFVRALVNVHGWSNADAEAQFELANLEVAKISAFIDKIPTFSSFLLPTTE